MSISEWHSGLEIDNKYEKRDMGGKSSKKKNVEELEQPPPPPNRADEYKVKDSGESDFQQKSTPGKVTTLKCSQIPKLGACAFLRKINKNFDKESACLLCCDIYRQFYLTLNHG